MKIQVRDAGTKRIIDVNGQLTLGNAVEALEETVMGLLNSGHCQIVVNLKNVPYIDTSGITQLVAAKKRCMDKDGDVKLLMPSKTAYRILASVALHTWFEILDTEAKAVGSF